MIYQIELFATHKLSKVEFLMSFIVEAETPDEALVRMAASYDLTGLEFTRWEIDEIKSPCVCTNVELLNQDEGDCDDE